MGGNSLLRTDQFYNGPSQDILPVPEIAPHIDPEYQQQDNAAPPSDNIDRVAKAKFEGWALGRDLSNPVQPPTDVAAQESSNKFWQNLGSGVVNAAGAVKDAALDNPYNPVGRPIRDWVGQGVQASAENTAGGLGVIANAENEARRNQIEEARKNMPAYAESLRSRQVYKGGAPRTAEEAAKAQMSTEKTSVIDRYMADQRVLGQSENFRSHVADIASRSGVNPDDWRVIFEAARAQRGEQGGFGDAIAEGLADPMNIPFAALGGGEAVNALNRGLKTVGSHAAEAGGIIADSLPDNPVTILKNAWKESGAKPMNAAGKSDEIANQQRWMEQQRRLQADQTAVDNEARLRGEAIRKQEEAAGGSMAPENSKRGGALRGEPEQKPLTDQERAQARRRDEIRRTLEDQNPQNAAGMSADEFDKTIAQINVHDATARGELPQVYGMADIRPSTIGANEPEVMQKLYEQYKAGGKFKTGSFRGAKDPLPANVQVTENIPGLGGDAVGGTYPTTPPFIQIKSGMSYDEFARTMQHELEHAGQNYPGVQGGMNSIDAERAAYGVTGETPPPIALEQSGEAAAKDTNLYDRNTYGYPAPSTPEGKRAALVNSLQSRGSTFPDAARGLSSPAEPTFAAGKGDQAAKSQIQEILDNMKNSQNPGNRTMATNIEKALAEGGTPESVLKDLQAGSDAFGMKGTPAETLAEVQRQKDLARARSIAEKIVNHPGATEADKIAAQEEVARLSGKPAKPGTGGALTKDEILGEILDSNKKVPDLTPEQIAEAKAPIRGDEVLPEEGNGNPMNAAPKEFAGKSTEEIAASLEKNFGKRPRGEQTTFGTTFGTGRAPETPIGTNLPTPVAKSAGRKMPGTQPFVDAQSKARITDIAGDLAIPAVGDAEQTMIDAGIRKKGFSVGSPQDIGKMGLNGISWAMRAPRELLVSADISMSLRQGGVAAISHPKEWAAAMKDELGAFASESNLADAEARIKAIPSYNFAQSVGLRNEIGASGVAKGTGARFEGYTQAIPRNTPVLGGVVRSSERASEAFLASIRTRIFDTYSKSWGLMDMDALANMTPKQIAQRTKDAKDLASFINSITGSGDLGFLEDHAKTLNSLFFSPRFFASRINNIFAPIVYAGQAMAGTSSWKMAGLATRDMLQFYGTTVGVLTAASQIPGVSVGTDPGKAGFGQIRVGDQVIDVTGGMARTLGEIGRLKSKTDQPDQFGQTNGRDELAHFLFGKLNAPISNATDILAANRDITGNPRGVTGHIPMPLDIQNLAQAVTADYQQNGAAGALQGGLLGSLEVLGLGVQTYPQDQSKHPNPDVSQNPIDLGLTQLTGIGRSQKKQGSLRF